MFYAGEVILIKNLEIKKIPAPPSSIILMQILDLLQDFQIEKDFIYIAESTLNYFVTELEKVNTWDSRARLSIGIEDNRPFVNQVSKETIKIEESFL